VRSIVMETANLKKFAQDARRQLMGQVSAKLKTVLAEDSLARRSNPTAVRALEEDIGKSSKEQVVERVAYTWFNRFTALRYMDANRYTTISVVSSASGQTQPEVLAEAKMGNIESEIPEKIRIEVMELLSGSKTSSNPQQRAYKLLLVAYCNVWHEAMPFLFERIQDYTELLMPDDLLSEQSIITNLQTVMTEDVCQDIEVIGWLYQFYISEKKDEVFDGLKKNKKVSAENIPAATQLFTPNWIVRYLVENSLGRLWMLNNPNSNLISKMQYYIKPEQPESDYLRISSPEEMKVCDPACGSGHMLVYAFDLLYSMYEEAGYNESEIPELILTKNLFGIEIDERAGELAAFALAMKARSKQRRFFRRNIEPNICVLENVQFESGEINQYIKQAGSGMFSLQVQNTLNQFEDADNFGSLIVPETNNANEVIQQLNAHNYSGSMLDLTHQKIMKALRQADYLSRKYHVVIANPPYMGSKGMNPKLASWVKENYPDSKSDLFAMFIERNLNLVIPHGMVSMITMQSWMFLSSFERLRMKMIRNSSILSMAHLGARAFDSIGGEVVSTTSFVLKKQGQTSHVGEYLRLIEGNSESAKISMYLEAVHNPDCGWFYRANAADFEKIPGSPIAYWASEHMLNGFSNGVELSKIAKPRQGLATSDNNRFLRLWFEVNHNNIGFSIPEICDKNKYRYKWFPCSKGGSFRRWYGNQDFVINWENDGKELKEYASILYKNFTRTIKNISYYFQEGLTWSTISSSKFSLRYLPRGHIFETKGAVCFFNNYDSLIFTLGLMNTKVVHKILGIISPTLDYHEGPIGRVPVVPVSNHNINSIVEKNTAQTKQDWDSYETSWNFSTLPLLQYDYRSEDLSQTYKSLRSHWQSMTDEMQQLEEENNRIFIEAYGLENELTPEVPIEEITLTCNPYYRYGNNKSQKELEALLLADTMREFISYAVGCMFGRYSLDKPGLILANQGETLQDYLVQVPEPTFLADDDNAIPILDDAWFTDEIVERFSHFLVVTFGQVRYKENLNFIENALGKDIRKYFLKEFYTDHVKRYKKRPIYWLFTSPKGTFNALIYMHRYRPDTVSVVLNKYLREFKVKLNARLDQYKRAEASADVSRTDKARAIREIDGLRKSIDELDQWERDVIFPLALQQIDIDLDDGVKVNYPKFGSALKKIPGLEAKED